MFSLLERMIAYRYLRSPRQEGFISVIAGFSFVGIALGVATLIIVMSVMNGFRQELLSRIVGMNGHITLQAASGPLMDFDDVAAKAKTVTGVTLAIPVVAQQAMVMFQSQARGAVVHGIRGDDLKKREMIAKNIKAGSLDLFGKAADSSHPSDTVIMGRRLAENLGLRVGDRLSLVSPQGNITAFGTMPRQKSVTLVGVFEVGFHEYDKSVIFMPLETAQGFFKMGGPEGKAGVSMLEVFVDNPDRVAEYGFVLRHTVDDGVLISDWQHMSSSFFQVVQVERNVMFIILALIILIAAFNIVSGLIMLVKDKMRDIAILRTMGATRGAILRIFFLTGATIGVTGTLTGLAGGLAFALNIETIRRWLERLLDMELFNAEIYFLTQMPCKIDSGDVIATVGMALGLSFLATLYPSWRAARLDPVEALRQ
ncbi:MAG: multidrug transporter substrate-binding protein [Alphaproteobacteria bacterium]|jgi:lipoprotein-releasing system permease protein|nr:multidrug transporter substrate-binding protein [Alphaproteobacteria bacterium]